jgi:manganese-dependent inorganic pyrophosphatase
VNAGEFTEKLFSSGSVLISLPAEQAIVADCKEFHEKRWVFSVAQIEEIGFSQFWKRKDEVLQALEQYRQREGYFFSALLVTDVVSNSSLLLITGSPGFLRQIDYPRIEEGVYELTGVVSRKKQLLPFLTHCLKSASLH